MLEGKLAGFDMQARPQARPPGPVRRSRPAKYPDRSWEHPPVQALFSPSYPLWTEVGGKNVEETAF